MTLSERGGRAVTRNENPVIVIVVVMMKNKKEIRPDVLFSLCVPTAC